MSPQSLPRHRNLLSNALSISWIGVLMVVFVLNARTASARALPGISDHLGDILPTKNATGGPMGEIQCYALPYGAIGIISHLLTYWTIAWMGVGKIPLWPWHNLKSSNFDMAVAVVTILTCIPLASVSIHRCRLSWHFVLIGVWKLITSVTLACVTIHRGIITRRALKSNSNSGSESLLNNMTPQVQQTTYSPYASPNPQRSRMYSRPNNSTYTSLFTSDDDNTPQVKTNHSPLYWLILYLLGTIAGMTGLCALIYTSFRHNKDVRHLTYGFAGAIIILPIIVALYFYKSHLQKPQGGGRVLKSAYQHAFWGAAITGIAAFGFFSALYSDLALGAIAGKWSGFPSEDFAPLYWAWFAAKRLPMLSH
ncbi:hypothetical protein K469DRAFT_713882 [Zopfia rhizophila CBS 207.26]|uniref:Uncharacterized protein n=1 Tax=Zopfia rhizophila CBS 207.26 TaxID=1314779 RepID=A0A6A6DPU1_9PEZI|nr:hypothetical protein K469DRAFT_713882 [Zopfia rhizophila CBS 207.26]